jgi:hypothetical protein
MSKVQREDTMFVQDARLEARVRNLEQFMNQQLNYRPQFKMVQTANQSINNLTVSYMDYQSAAIDLGTDPTMVDLTNNVVTIRRAGLWLIGYKVMWNADPDGIRMGSYVVNNPAPPGTPTGPWHAQQRMVGAPGANQVVVNGSEPIRLAVNDTVRGMVYHDAGAALSTFTGGNDTNTLWGIWMSD